MSFELNHEIDQFCAQVSVAQGLDEEIHDEMRAHLTEKVDYYLNKRHLTEEEAFKLASMAMGDPEKMAAEMRSVYPVEATATKAFGLLHVLGCFACVAILHRALGAFVLHVLQGKADYTVVEKMVDDPMTSDIEVAVTYIVEAYDGNLVLFLLSAVVVYFGMGAVIARLRKKGRVRERLVAYLPIGLLCFAGSIALLSVVIPSFLGFGSASPQWARVASRILSDSVPYGSMDLSLVEIISDQTLQGTVLRTALLVVLRTALLAAFCGLLAARLGLEPRKCSWASFLPLAWLLANEAAAAGGTWIGAGLTIVGLSGRHWGVDLLSRWSVSGMLVVVLSLTAFGCVLGWGAFLGCQRFRSARTETA